MKNALPIILLFVFLASDFEFLTSNCFAQETTDEQLAGQFYNNGEYGKAVLYYEKLFGDDRNNQLYYNYYLNCLIKLKEFGKAEKVISKQYKNEPGHLSYGVDLGFVYHAAGNEKKSIEAYQSTLKLLKADEAQIRFLAGSFLNRGLTDYAVETYIRGRKLFNGYYSFRFELAEVYKKTQAFNSMIGELIDQAEYDLSSQGKVENHLQAVMAEYQQSKLDELLRIELLKRIQKNPDQIVFPEMLIWLFIQEKDFQSAFLQAKALDIRFKEDGQRLIGLAKISASNKDFDAAIQCYQYVIGKGKNNYYYIGSRMELLSVMNEKITSSPHPSISDLNALDVSYNTTLNELGKSSNTILLLKGLAHLKAFYLHSPIEAISILEDALKLTGATAENLAQCKTELADVYLMTGEVWEATLLYSQVDKAFKQDPIGHEAKFRNAKLSYYIGEFFWAQGQLNVLKSSTSKLIANDAMELSLMISDNSALDTTNDALVLFARADLLVYQNRDSIALLTLDTLNKQFPGHSLADDILFLEYKIMLRGGKMEKAAGLLEEITKNYGYDLLADDALFQLAEMNELVFNNSEKAKELYQKLFTDLPGSVYAVEARKRYRKLRGDTL